MDLLPLDPDELLTTTRSVRKRLDFDRPVERAVVEECLEVALQAPTGSNTQGWQWVVVDDPALKAAIAGHYGRNYDEYAQNPASAAFADDDPRAQRRDAVRSSSRYLRERLHEVPVMVIPCIAGRFEGLPSFAQASMWGSILPAVWSFMLALRARGLGSAWTTLHLPDERAVADLLGIPYDRYTQAGLFPVAHTLGTDFKPAPRLPLADVLHWNGW
ncbi:MAG: nitroreductase family protein [Acidimicrobiales bacterium]|nr:nitroreductase family protein [Acidimicrobiales bacterium]